MALDEGFAYLRCPEKCNRTHFDINLQKKNMQKMWLFVQLI